LNSALNHDKTNDQMRKLINGIIEFRNKRRPDYKDTFARLALGQKPDALFVGCSDSRVAVNVFASTDPGDLFVVRNVGNLIPPANATSGSVGAAIEFALTQLGVKDIIVCGHSECGAMQALIAGREKITTPHLSEWLKNGEPALKELAAKTTFAPGLEPNNRLSQLNVLRQLENLKLYPLVRERVEAGTLGLHGWWFELRTAEVHAFDATTGAFKPIAG
jgi:carbonic anhydrase